MSIPAPQLSQQIELPPTPALEKESPKTLTWITKLYVALKKRHQDISSVTATATSGDVFANLPAAGTKGRLFYAVDTHTLYADDGTVWTAV